MALANQERANVIIGAIFADLLENWPKYTDLRVEKFLASDTGEYFDQDIELFMALVQWLCDEGYLRYETASTSGAFYMSVLSEKGLRTLNAIPLGIAGATTFGDKIIEASKEVSKDSAKKIIGDLVGQMIGGAIKSLSGN
jgi:hypothetical protein